MGFAFNTRGALIYSVAINLGLLIGLVFANYKLNQVATSLNNTVVTTYSVLEAYSAEIEKSKSLEDELKQNSA